MTFYPKPNSDLSVGRFVRSRKENLQKWLEKRIQKEERVDIIDK
jgi:hypothetical protein